MTASIDPASARILNVDDNDAARYVKTRVLTRAGFRVVEACSGHEALALTRSESPELVLLDVKLPDLNGLEVCRRLKTDPVTATVIVLQTSASLIDSAHRVRALDAGADSYLVEPIDAEELVANVKALLRMRRAEEAHQRAEGALRASEERFRQLAQSVSDVFWVLSPDEPGFQYVSPAYERLWGRSAEPLYRSWQEWFAAIHPEDRPQVHASFARLLQTGVYEQEYRIVGADGQARWIAERGFPIRDAQGAMHRFAGIAQDITSRKQAELLLLETDRHKDEFLAMLAHELRNPLGPIRSAVDLLARRDTPRDAVDDRAIAIIGRQAGHLTRLVDDLLDISRISHGKITLRFEPVELRGVLQSALETTRAVIEARGHRVTLAMPDAPIWLRGDAVRLSQVFGNLLNNAAKFTPEGGDIALRVEPAGPEVRVHVIDNGSGIRPELLPRIFGLFTQGDRSLDRSQGGLGIGLSLVRRLVELHGGSVQAVSAGPGQGAEFSVVLPVVATPAPPQPAAAEPTPHSRRVLVVDDNTDAAEALGLLLRLHDHEVVVCGDSSQALATVPGLRPDVVLLDVGLPGMNGYEVARALRQMPEMRATVLIALTGYGSESDRAQAHAAGFDHHLVKPADLQQLLALVAEGPIPA